jgi:hypothetical protein
MTEQRRTFVLRLRAAPGTDAIRSLRRLLKIALRQLGLRCVDAYEEKPGECTKLEIAPAAERGQS